MRCELCGMRRATRLVCERPAPEPELVTALAGWGLTPDEPVERLVCAACDDGAWDEAIVLETGRVLT